MLVLSRLIGEEVVVGDGIIVRVMDIRGNKVRLGFIAPKDTTIHRREVYDEIHKKESDPNPSGD